MLQHEFGRMQAHNPLEDHAASTAAEAPPIRERRNRERFALQCPVVLQASGEERADNGMTMNISSRGIYLISQLRFTPGEEIRCSISITPNGFRSQVVPVSLKCRIRVVRVEERAHGYGIGCCIENYALSLALRDSGLGPGFADTARSGS